MPTIDLTPLGSTTSPLVLPALKELVFESCRLYTGEDAGRTFARVLATVSLPALARLHWRAAWPAAPPPPAGGAGALHGLPRAYVAAHGRAGVLCACAVGGACPGAGGWLAFSGKEGEKEELAKATPWPGGAAGGLAAAA